MVKSTDRRFTSWAGANVLTTRIQRRRFLTTAAAGSCLATVSELSFLARLRPVGASETQLPPNSVRFSPEIEPLVRLLEETPREQLMERFAERIQLGLPYRRLLTALLLAGVRNIQPRPSVGFKFHAVLVVNSAHLASLSSPAADRWLPIFWALDYFKSSQARDVQEGNWTMTELDEAAVLPGHKARKAFITALERWDEAAADVAVAGLTRAAGAAELFELFARFGVRDFRSIGHKAIFVANSWRTLQCIGWRYAEPVLRSLAYALLNHEGQPNPAESDLEADRPWRRNQRLVGRIRSDWRDGRTDVQAAADLLATLRNGSPDDACDLTIELLNRGVAVQSVYDALFMGAGELLMRQPGIVALHALTTSNAMYQLYATVRDDETRKLILLQNAAFLPMFRAAMRGRGQVGDGRIDTMPTAAPGDSDDALAAIFREVSTDRDVAARRVLGYLTQGGSPEHLIARARQLVFLKGNDSHDYKFSSAVLEDYYHVSPDWRNRYLAAAVYNLRGALENDNQLVARMRSALGT